MNNFILLKIIRIKPFFKKLSCPWGDSKKIFQNTISVNIAFLSIILAFYIAVSTYFSPQLKQLRIERNLEFNRMLMALDKTIDRRLDKSKYLRYYNNDTLDIGKIGHSILIESFRAKSIYFNVNELPIISIVQCANQYVDTLSLISLISNYPILDPSKESEDSLIRHIVKGKAYIPYNEKTFTDIDNFIHLMTTNEMNHSKKDIKLIEYSSRYQVLTSSKDKSSEILNEVLDSLKNEYANLKTSDWKKKRIIGLYEAEIERHINQLSIYSSLYENMKSIYQTYIIDIYELNFKESLYKNLLSTLYHQVCK